MSVPYSLKKMILNVIQYNCSAINSVYIYEDFLENLEYLNSLKEKLITHLDKKDNKDYQTNVYAKMTNWTELLNDNDFSFLHEKILRTLNNTLKLRIPTPNESLRYSYTDSWGMVHKEGDFTHDHIHSYNVWSGAFYFDVPHPTRMWFEDFQKDVELKTNMLVLFHGITKHRVPSFTGDKLRYSMGFNIKIEQLDT